MSKARRKIIRVIPSTVMFDTPALYQQTLSSTRFLTLGQCCGVRLDPLYSFSFHTTQLLTASSHLFCLISKLW